MRNPVISVFPVVHFPVIPVSPVVHFSMIPVFPVVDFGARPRGEREDDGEDQEKPAGDRVTHRRA
jgi:hypothetical protein